MSLTDPPYGIAFQGFPRVSGDEPARQRARQAAAKFSPRERG